MVAKIQAQGIIKFISLITKKNKRMIQHIIVNNQVTKYTLIIREK